MARTMRDKVIEKVARYWPGEDPQEIMRVLDAYGANSLERGRDRVQFAIIKLSAGRRERLAELVAAAKVDYRDVLAWAEYPEEFKLGFVGMSELSPEEARAVRQRDMKQYLKWLGR